MMLMLMLMMLLGAATLGGAAVADAAPQPVATWAAFNGMNGLVQDSLSGQVAVNWVRTGLEFEWAAVEPARGQFNFSAADAIVDSLVAQNVSAVVTLAYTAPWAAGDQGIYGPARSPQDWTNYVSAVVQRYMARGITYYQVWNEPTRESGHWNGSTNVGWVDDVYLPAASIVRQHGGKVVFGGWPSTNSLSELTSVLEHNNAYNVTDVLDVHYCDPGNWSQVHDAWSGRIKGGLWQTEFGWRDEAAFVATSYPRILWKALTNEDWNTPDYYKLFWYTWWSASTNKSIVHGGSGGGADETWTEHGMHLATLSWALFGNVSADILHGLNATTDFSSTPTMSPTYANMSAPGAFGIYVGGGREAIVFALDAELRRNNPTLSVSSPMIELSEWVACVTARGDNVAVQHTSLDGVTVSTADIPLEQVPGGQLAIAYIVVQM